MSNSNIASIGRFSSQMLTYLGTQKTVKLVNGSYENTFKYATGVTSFIDAGSLLQSILGGGVVGNFSPNAYNSVKAFFISRGASVVYADTMTAITIDIAAALNVSPLALLEKSEIFNKIMFSTNAYRVFNELRDPTHQLGAVTTVLNRDSLQARQIRS